MAFSEQDKRALLIGIVIAIVISAIGGYFYITMGKNFAKKYILQTEKANKDISEAKKKLKVINSLENRKPEIEALSKRVLDVSQKLPSNLDPSAFYSALVDILKETGLAYQEIAPEPPVVRSLYTEIPYKITLTASYHEFGQFVNLLEENPKRILRIKYFSIKNDLKQPSAHPIVVKLNTFLLKGK